MQLTIGKMTQEDDKDAVARLIYATDDYIFPYMYRGDLTAAIAVLGEMMAADTLYRAENITVARADGKIAGIVVAQRTPIRISCAEMSACFARAGYVADEHAARTYGAYYLPLEREKEGVYIANVCVDGAFRGKGVAKAMLTALLREDETYRLEAVKANTAAVRLYEGLGFTVEETYAGFMDVPCYRMVRAPKKEGA